MDVFTAANIFYKSAQTIDPALAKNYSTIKKLSDILVSPYARDDLQSGLIKNLEIKVKALPEDIKWSITTSPSKSAVTQLYNLLKVFYNSLVKKDNNKTAIQNSFNQALYTWRNYCTLYFDYNFF